METRKRTNKQLGSSPDKKKKKKDGEQQARGTQHHNIWEWNGLHSDRDKIYETHYHGTDTQFPLSQT